MYCLAGYVLALLAGRSIESGLRRDFLLRRQDQEYIRTVAIVTEAAQAVEAGAFEPAGLDPVASRNDALGHPRADLPAQWPARCARASSACSSRSRTCAS